MLLNYKTCQFRFIYNISLLLPILYIDLYKHCYIYIFVKTVIRSMLEKGAV